MIKGVEAASKVASVAKETQSAAKVAKSAEAVAKSTVGVAKEAETVAKSTAGAAKSAETVAKGTKAAGGASTAAKEAKGATEATKEASATSGAATVAKTETVVESASKNDSILADRIDYSYRFNRELANFNDGYKIKTVVDRDLLLVQYSSDAPDASLCYWTTVDEANGITTLNEYMDKLALSKNWGNRNTVKVAKIPAGTEVKYAVGTAREQLLIADPRPGGGIQYLFNQFDNKWVVEIRNFPN